MSGMQKMDDAWADQSTQTVPARLESVQDFLIKLDMKPCMHLVEISIFSLNLVIVSLIGLIFEDFSTLGMKKFPYLKTGPFGNSIF